MSMDKATADKMAEVIAEFKKVEWRQNEDPPPLNADLYEALCDLEQLAEALTHPPDHREGEV